jgi:hypothetical protein
MDDGETTKAGCSCHDFVSNLYVRRIDCFCLPNCAVHINMPVPLQAGKGSNPVHRRRSELTRKACYWLGCVQISHSASSSVFAHTQGWSLIQNTEDSSKRLEVWPMSQGVKFSCSSLPYRVGDSEAEMTLTVHTVTKTLRIPQ